MSPNGRGKPRGSALSAWDRLRPLPIQGQVSGCTPTWKGEGEERSVPELSTPSRSPLGPRAVSRNPRVQEGGRKGDVAARLRQACRTSPWSQVSAPYAVFSFLPGRLPLTSPRSPNRVLRAGPKLRSQFQLRASICRERVITFLDA
ncbi:hypothetical protein NDU88_006936 [Pleurodeles waltl]|uniref:Uncharacterized protein n=1 Tax=Pleurodeles waltl TaxID=8319 RepID=A0AAV7UMZ8_PLEWA|nr:hypothetical protein NDU88_006936 [Pleurodeles waltl]